jgi:hypothetical protein
MEQTTFREKVKREIDKVDERNLEIVYQFLKKISDRQEYQQKSSFSDPLDWSHFINEMYGSMADAPIKRWNEGSFEIREPIE